MPVYETVETNRKVKVNIIKVKVILLKVKVNLLKVKVTILKVKLNLLKKIKKKQFELKC